MTTQINFHHEATQGVVDPEAGYRHEFTVSGEKFQVLADLGAPGEHYLIDKRIVDGRSPFLRAVSYVSRHQCWRLSSVANASSNPVAFIVAPKVGVAKVAHAGTEVELKPGQYTLCVSSEPTVSRYSADSEIILGFIPDIDMVQDRRLTRHIGKEMSIAGVGQLLLRHLDISLQIAPVLDSLALAAASNAAGELLPSLVFPSPSSYSPRTDALRDQIKTYIEVKLHEPGLCAEQIAAAHYVSVRTVYRIFDKSDQSVAAYIRARRLEHCRTEVEQRPDLSLTAICQRWGIPDPKHFARQYRRYFGESPSDARRRLSR